MDINFRYMSMEDLANMYLKADKELKEALLNGANWEDIREKRRIHTELSIAVNRMRSPEDYGDSPANRPSGGRWHP